MKISNVGLYVLVVASVSSLVSCDGSYWAVEDEEVAVCGKYSKKVSSEVLAQRYFKIFKEYVESGNVLAHEDFFASDYTLYVEGREIYSSNSDRIAGWERQWGSVAIELRNPSFKTLGEHEAQLSYWTKERTWEGEEYWYFVTAVFYSKDGHLINHADFSFEKKDFPEKGA